ncbi:MAG: hypothetical protein JOZ07_11915 [Solirubrobacterales bacterium]|nr:hypothetical protein [Solirubrobacterales bacterium]
MTIEIARQLNEQGRTWDTHLRALLEARDLEAALASFADEPSVRYVPSMTGGSGDAGVRSFYRDALLAHLPDDLARSRISRTVDQWRLVDEATVSFTHDRELPWLLPGIEPSGRRAEVLTLTVIDYAGETIRAQRMLWDHASLCAQLELTRLGARPAASR